MERGGETRKGRREEGREGGREQDCAIGSAWCCQLIAAKQRSESAAEVQEGEEEKERNMQRELHVDRTKAKGKGRREVKEREFFKVIIDLLFCIRQVRERMTYLK